LEGEEVPLTDAQREELDQRIARYERNPSDVVPWEHVKADLINRT
jgi:putative addiction module component (TIGR02574 family)